MTDTIAHQHGRNNDIALRLSAYLGIDRVVGFSTRHEGLRMRGVTRSRDTDVGGIDDAENSVEVRCL